MLLLHSDQKLFFCKINKTQSMILKKTYHIADSSDQMESNNLSFNGFKLLDGGNLFSTPQFETKSCLYRCIYIFLNSFKELLSYNFLSSLYCNGLGQNTCKYYINMVASLPSLVLLVLLLLLNEMLYFIGVRYVYVIEGESTNFLFSVDKNNAVYYVCLQFLKAIFTLQMARVFYIFSTEFLVNSEVKIEIYFNSFMVIVLLLLLYWLVLDWLYRMNEWSLLWELSVYNG